MHFKDGYAGGVDYWENMYSIWLEMSLRGGISLILLRSTMNLNLRYLGGGFLSY